MEINWKKVFFGFSLLMTMGVGVWVFLLVGPPGWSGQEEEFPVLLKTPEFELVNCTGETVGDGDLSGKIWVVNFIFTRCAGPCPLMTQRMLSVQKGLEEKGLLEAEGSVKLVSITVDPGYDSPEVLKAYADLWKADLAHWFFLTGPEQDTLDLIRNGFKSTVEHPQVAEQAEPDQSGEHAGHGEATGHAGHGDAGAGAMHTIIHSTNFMLVDGQGQVRRIYRLDEADMSRQVIAGIETLLEEES